MNILVLNAGSSTQKSCLYAIAEPVPVTPPEPLWEGVMDWGRSTNGSTEGAEITVKANGIHRTVTLESGPRTDGLAQLLSTLVEGETAVLPTLKGIDRVGHRVVHGGTAYSQATFISEDVKAAIARLVPLAPSHNPAHLEGIYAIEQVLGTIPQVAVFDTAFHSHMPTAAAAYPIPFHWFEKGVRRYGFHGISHQYCAHRAAQILEKPLEHLKLVTCHLGNGASLAAVSQGVSINTTMGFTPLEGLMMGTRSGTIDPAIALYLMRDHGLSCGQVDQMLNRESGLKGIFGPSGDMRAVLQAMETGDPQATLAFDMYAHRLRTNMGAMVASLGGLDALIFAGGVGEHAARVREAACQGLEFLGVHLDPAKNDASPQDTDIAKPESPVRVLIIHTQEDWAIACECFRL